VWCKAQKITSVGKFLILILKRVVRYFLVARLNLLWTSRIFQNGGYCLYSSSVIPFLICQKHHLASLHFFHNGGDQLIHKYLNYNLISAYFISTGSTQKLYQSKSFNFWIMLIHSHLSNLFSDRIISCSATLWKIVTNTLNNKKQGSYNLAYLGYMKRKKLYFYWNL
jgi:hypothetical protein